MPEGTPARVSVGDVVQETVYGTTFDLGQRSAQGMSGLSRHRAATASSYAAGSVFTRWSR
ncbi:hypothetical protein AB0C68_30195 [Streptomyces tendae]|uniref:hypothetical protein n=1 Tax=Streptomyces tendae TaxID=1932 RepID=UPI0033F33877